ncbi:MAG: hypothetical protein ACYC6J_09775 [Coriobacteriia bacterium]
MPLIRYRRVPDHPVLICRVIEDRLGSARPPGARGLAGVPRVRRAVRAACSKPFGALSDSSMPSSLRQLAERLRDPQTLLDDERWQDFLAAPDERTADSRVALEHYVSWWLQGHELWCRDPMVRFSAPGVVDPQYQAECDAAAEAQAWFELLFPALFFAVAYLARRDGFGDLLERVAVTDPFQLPEFAGLDLWLQRRAFLAVLRGPRAATLGAFAGRVRNGLLYHAATVFDVPVQERRALAGVLREAECFDDHGYWLALDES